MVLSRLRGGDLGAGEATMEIAMKKLLALLTTVSAVGLYTASAYAGDNCNISALSCNGIGNGNSSYSKTIETTKVTVSVPIGSGNNNHDANNSGSFIGGNGNSGNTITSVGNNSQSFGGKH
jgi:hypothetical protein